MVFTWDSTVDVQPGDAWLWHRDDTGERGTTRRPRLTLQTTEAVCVEVKMSRGRDTSSGVQECVPGAP